MKQKLKTIILSLSILLIFGTPALAAVEVFEECDGNTSQSEVCANKNSGQLLADGSLMRNGLQIFIVIIGFTSLVMVMVGGFRYILSAGDPQQAAGAKNTILYAIVGLVIALSAQGILTFVIDRI